MPDHATAVATPAPSRQAWLDHPAVARHYRDRGHIDGRRWEEWVVARRGGPIGRALELVCGAGARSLFLFEHHLVRSVDGVDPGEDQILAAEANRASSGAPGVFRAANPNALRLPRGAYDLVFACHALHQVVALERLLDEAYAALTPDGLFVVEGFVGPSRFQWTEAQMRLVETILSCVPERLRTLPWGVPKTSEGRPDRAAVTAQSPFEAIRSSEIVALVRQRFSLVAVRPLGGTLQNLFYNGIVHNFADDDAEASRIVDLVARAEDALIDTGLLPSDFVIMIGCRR